MSRIYKIILLNFFLISFWISFFSIVKSQPDILNQNQPGQKLGLITDWSTQQSFVPRDYEGKILPTFNSIVNLSVTSTKDSIFNENDYAFNWIIDNSTALPSKKQVASFKISNGGGDKHKVYLRIFNKNGNLVDDYYFEIPIFKHQVVLYTENINSSLVAVDGTIFATSDSTIKFTVKPFFFNNISDEADLKYSWKLNNKKMDTDTLEPNKLEILFPKNIPIGTQYNLKLSIENPLDNYQSVEKNYIIKIN